MSKIVNKQRNASVASIHRCNISASHGVWSCVCAEHESMLLLSVRNEIRVLTLDTDDRWFFRLPLKLQLNSVAVDYDPRDDLVYWADDQVLTSSHFYTHFVTYTGKLEHILLFSDGVGLCTTELFKYSAAHSAVGNIPQPAKKPHRFAFCLLTIICTTTDAVQTANRSAVLSVLCFFSSWVVVLINILFVLYSSGCFDQVMFIVYCLFNLLFSLVFCLLCKLTISLISILFVLFSSGCFDRYFLVL